VHKPCTEDSSFLNSIENSTLFCEGATFESSTPAIFSRTDLGSGEGADGRENFRIWAETGYEPRKVGLPETRTSSWLRGSRPSQDADWESVVKTFSDGEINVEIK